MASLIFEFKVDDQGKFTYKPNNTWDYKNDDTIRVVPVQPERESERSALV